MLYPLSLALNTVLIVLSITCMLEGYVWYCKQTKAGVFSTAFGWLRYTMSGLILQFAALNLYYTIEPDALIEKAHTLEKLRSSIIEAKEESWIRLR